jgi:hypothetical protein
MRAEAKVEGRASEALRDPSNEAGVCDIVTAPWRRHDIHQTR